MSVCRLSFSLTLPPFNLFERNDSEIVEVPEDSADAKRWPLWIPTNGQNEKATATVTTTTTAPSSGGGGDSGMPKPPTGDALPSGSTTPTPPPSVAATTAATTAAATGTKPRPGRRKPKVQLADVPSAADSRKGLKRLSTLEKSALDWKAHVDDDTSAAGPGQSGLASELEANRRGGGYLEKVEFLRRVEDRKNQSLEANKDQKRRRG